MASPSVVLFLGAVSCEGARPSAVGVQAAYSMCGNQLRACSPKTPLVGPRGLLCIGGSKRIRDRGAKTGAEV